MFQCILLRLSLANNWKSLQKKSEWTEQDVFFSEAGKVFVYFNNERIRCTRKVKCYGSETIQIYLI